MVVLTRGGKPSTSSPGETSTHSSRGLRRLLSAGSASLTPDDAEQLTKHPTRRTGDMR